MRIRWERVVPWLNDKELWVFLVPLAFLMIVGLGSC